MHNIFDLQSSNRCNNRQNKIKPRFSGNYYGKNKRETSIQELANKNKNTTEELKNIQKNKPWSS